MTGGVLTSGEHGRDSSVGRFSVLRELGAGRRETATYAARFEPPPAVRPPSSQPSLDPAASLERGPALGAHGQGGERRRDDDDPTPGRERALDARDREQGHQKDRELELAARARVEETVVLECYPGKGDPSDPSFEAVARSAALLPNLVHWNIARVRAVVASGDDLIVVNEFVEGETYADLTEGGRLAHMPFAVRLRIIVDLLGGLSALHGFGERRAHRGVSPANIVVGRDGRTRLLRICNLGDVRAAPAAAATYVAPELLEGATAGPSADIYSVGVLLWEALCGERWAAPADGSTWRVAVQNKVPPAGIPADDLEWALDLVPIVERALDDSAARFDTAADMAAAIRLTARAHLATTEEVADYVERSAGAKITERVASFAAQRRVGPIFEGVTLDERRASARRLLSAMASVVTDSDAVALARDPSTAPPEQAEASASSSRAAATSPRPRAKLAVAAAACVALAVLIGVRVGAHLAEGGHLTNGAPAAPVVEAVAPMHAPEAPPPQIRAAVPVELAAVAASAPQVSAPQVAEPAGGAPAPVAPPAKTAPAIAAPRAPKASDSAKPPRGRGRASQPAAGAPAASPEEAAAPVASPQPSEAGRAAPVVPESPPAAPGEHAGAPHAPSGEATDPASFAPHGI